MAISLTTASWATWGASNLVRSGAHAGEPANAVVKLAISVPESARTAANLGTQREGTGVVIDSEGLILTIGYLLIEAQSILIVTNDGRVLPGTAVGFDHVTGFGLVHCAQPPGCKPIAFGDSARALELNAAIIVAHSSAGGLSNAAIVGRRPFTGWWEYALDDAIFTAPPRDRHSGAALIDEDGRLIGIGSLWVGDALDAGTAFPGNMFVPTDLLKPILPELRVHGRRQMTRPWIGVYTENVEEHVVIYQVLPGSPAERAGVKRGDVLLSVGGETVASQAEFYRALWASGAAGTRIRMQLWRKQSAREVLVQSIDRLDYLHWSAAGSNS
jgi:S1-C subfamily serine protease